MGSGMGERATATLRVQVVVAGTAALLLLALLASTIGSPIAKTPTRDFDRPTETLLRTSQGASGSPPTRSFPPPSAVPETPAWMYAVIFTVLLGIAGTILYLVARWIRGVARTRRTDNAPPPPSIPPEAAATALLDDEARHWAALDEGEPDEAVIAMWVALERSVARAGIERLPAETSGELTVRVLYHLDVDPEAVSTLASLYREARFSRHRLSDEQRDQARQALGRVHASLGRRGQNVDGDP